jgi:DNA mismatch endonuclease, patch repair protein
MADKISPDRRSKNMRAIRARNTKPELAVRSAAHRMGYRFRLHRRDLPGKPDIVFPGHRKIIFVHGCFWHHHSKCVDGRFPKTSKTYWRQKILGNVERDKKQIKQLTSIGWKVLVIWECQIKTRNPQSLNQKIKQFLDE